ncbi:MAG: hypothetical protein JSS27_10295 [Planctomycetes bacterium]|nr:hypothetical protein [Planctomycetota bacterium]
MTRCLLIIAVIVGAFPVTIWAAVEPAAAAPKVAGPTWEAMHHALAGWLGSHNLDPAARQRAEQLWPAAAHVPRDAWLDQLAAALAQGDPRIAALVEQCSKPRTGMRLPETAILADPQLPPVLSRQLKLYYGRWLAQQNLYDESLQQLKDLDPSESIDPATLLFYQGVAYQRLLQKDPGLKVIDRLMNDVAEVPLRYKALARLMRRDLEGLDAASLDHISRRMDDIRRRLDLGHGGERVRREEDGVIKSLDKLIEEIEQQQQQQQQQQAGGSSGGSRTPMQTPRLAPAQGAGEVDHRRLGNSSGWGDLPAKQREAALQEIGKEFPAHYRDVIEQYFRSLAEEAKP